MNDLRIVYDHVGSNLYGLYASGTTPGASNHSQEINNENNMEDLVIKYTGESDLYEQIIDPSYLALFADHTFENGEGTLTLISGVYAIPANCFYDYDFDTMELPEGIVSIGAVAFSRSTLTEITLPATMRSIAMAFVCENLTTVTCYATTPPELAADVQGSGNFPNGETLYVPKSSIQAYSESLWGQKFANILPIEDECVNPRGYGFSMCGMIDTNYMME